MSEPVSILQQESLLLAEIADCARAEAAAAARKIALAKKYQDMRYRYDTAAPGVTYDHDMAARSALAEVALETTTTYSVVLGWVNLFDALWRLPRVRDLFEAGAINIANIRAIIDHTTGAPEKLVRSIETSIMSAAQRLPSRALGAEVDRLLIEADPDWATTSRERAEKTRRVTTRRLPHGMAQVKSTVTATESVEIDSLIADVVKTVCRQDPRELQQLHIDAYMALLRGQTQLHCQCIDPDCPRRDTVDEPRPQVRINITCSLETLLGIGTNPCYLDGYGALDADKARALAADATWQALITAATTLADKIDTKPDLPLGPLDIRNRTWLPKCPDAGLAPDAGIVVARSRILPSGKVLPVGGAGLARIRNTNCNRVLDDLYRHTHTTADHMTKAEFADGHGGFTTPPPGALTYTPSAALATAVRLRDGTCRHPGCTTPAADCQLDHIVEYRHDNPESGGWTILANIQCLCPRHHQLKTAKIWHYELLPGALIHAHNTHGQHAYSLPAFRC